MSLQSQEANTNSLEMGENGLFRSPQIHNRKSSFRKAHRNLSNSKSEESEEDVHQQLINQKAGARLLGVRAPTNPFISPVKKAPTLKRIGGYQNIQSNSVSRLKLKLGQRDLHERLQNSDGQPSKEWKLLNKLHKIQSQPTSHHKTGHSFGNRELTTSNIAEDLEYSNTSLDTDQFDHNGKLRSKKENDEAGSYSNQSSNANMEGHLEFQQFKFLEGHELANHFEDFEMADLADLRPEELRRIPVVQNRSSIPEEMITQFPKEDIFEQNMMLMRSRSINDDSPFEAVQRQNTTDTNFTKQTSGTNHTNETSTTQEQGTPMQKITMHFPNAQTGDDKSTPVFRLKSNDASIKKRHGASESSQEVKGLSGIAGGGLKLKVKKIQKEAGASHNPPLGLREQAPAEQRVPNIRDFHKKPVIQPIKAKKVISRGRRLRITVDDRSASRDRKV